jgi:hypothetical protein
MSRFLGYFIGNQSPKSQPSWTKVSLTNASVGFVKYKPEYVTLHEQIIEYLVFLRDTYRHN